jgi:hypothetical protein
MRGHYSEGGQPRCTVPNYAGPLKLVPAVNLRAQH